MMARLWSRCGCPRSWPRACCQRCRTRHGEMRQPAHDPCRWRFQRRWGGQGAGCGAHERIWRCLLVPKSMDGRRAGPEQRRWPIPWSGQPCSIAPERCSGSMGSARPTANARYAISVYRGPERWDCAVALSPRRRAIVSWHGSVPSSGRLAIRASLRLMAAARRRGGDAGCRPLRCPRRTVDGAGSWLGGGHLRCCPRCALGGGTRAQAGRAAVELRGQVVA